MTNMAEKIQFLMRASLGEHWIEIAWVLTLLFLAKVLLQRVVRKLAQFTEAGGGKREAVKKRAETLGHVVVTTGSAIIYIIVCLMVLRLFGVDITPILAGAGIVGLAVGFGSQALVKDFVSSLFILIENQYGVGDKVKVNGLEGTVIRITMRSTMLRDEKGGRYYLSNGSITSVINFSQKD